MKSINVVGKSFRALKENFEFQLEDLELSREELLALYEAIDVEYLRRGFE